LPAPLVRVGRRSEKEWSALPRTITSPTVGLPGRTRAGARGLPGIFRVNVIPARALEGQQRRVTAPIGVLRRAGTAPTDFRRGSHVVLLYSVTSTEHKENEMEPTQPPPIISRVPRGGVVTAAGPSSRSSREGVAWVASSSTFPGRGTPTQGSCSSSRCRSSTSTGPSGRTPRDGLPGSSSCWASWLGREGCCCTLPRTALPLRQWAHLAPGRGGC
jgi:hypothetical protein